MRNIYAIRDRRAEDLVGYFPLVVMRTDAQAIRYFGDSIAQEKSALGAHPEDYELIRCGAVRDDGGIVGTPNGEPTLVITGNALIAAAKGGQELPDHEDTAEIRKVG